MAGKEKQVKKDGVSDKKARTNNGEMNGTGSDPLREEQYIQVSWK